MHNLPQSQSGNVCLPEIGAKVPDFSANTTFGPITMSDFEGKWVVLFSHPGDFTPVCTTEFIAFACSYREFQKRNAELIGLSIDTVYAHLGWVYNIYRNTGVEIPFPVIEDINKEVSTLYGMISPAASDISTVRAVFIIDSDQVLRAILYYPSEVGRNVTEILRILDALQTADREKAATPANWMPGQALIVPPPRTYDELLERAQGVQGFKCVDWYLCYRAYQPESIHRQQLDETHADPDDEKSDTAG